MTAVAFKEVCPKCNGTGVDTTPGGPGSGQEKPCENCDATGYRDVVHSDDLDTRLSTLETKSDTLGTKLDTIDSHLDTIEAKIDALE